MKMIKNILFEVLPIAENTFFPPVWQLVDATPKKLSLFRGKPVIEAFLYIFVRSEVLVRKCVPSMQINSNRKEPSLVSKPRAKVFPN